MCVCLQQARKIELEKGFETTRKADMVPAAPEIRAKKDHVR